MSNLDDILKGRGVSQNPDMSERAQIKRAIKTEALTAAFDEIGLAGFEVVNNDEVVTHEDEVLYHIPAEPIELYVTPP